MATAEIMRISFLLFFAHTAQCAPECAASWALNGPRGVIGVTKKRLHDFRSRPSKRRAVAWLRLGSRATTVSRLQAKMVLNDDVLRPRPLRASRSIGRSHCAALGRRRRIGRDARLALQAHQSLHS